MYEYIKGKLVEITASYAIIEAEGVGYRLLVPASYLGTIDEEEITLYTSFVVREQSQTLFGFLTKEERELFEIVTTVSGIGPKTALALLGHLSGEELMQAVHTHDILQIAKVPGIGKKTAERLIIELKGKVKGAYAKPLGKNRLMQDALAALLNLGYKQTHAEKAVQKAKESLPEHAPLSAIIAMALKA